MQNTHTNLTNILWNERRQTQKSTVKSRLYQNQAKSICDVRSQDSGFFVGPGDGEGQEGFGVRVIYSFFVRVLLPQM